MRSENSRFRLRSSAFTRPDEEQKIEPKKVLFLSVEGDQTERCYFGYLQNHFEVNKYNSIIRIEVLRHKRGDGYSSPEDVIELLNEYVAMRDGALLPAQLPKSFIDKYSRETIKVFLDSPENLNKTVRNGIDIELLELGIDISYRKYLNQLSNENDCFAIVIDRDCGSHSRELMDRCVTTCKDKGYKCFITNPCFEFWLLLHLCDVKSEYSDVLDKLLENEKISHAHTYVSNEVSMRANHGKRISKSTFKNVYADKINQAIENSKSFPMDLELLLDSVGTNLQELFVMIGYNV